MNANALPPDARLMQLIFGKTLTQCVSLLARFRLADHLASGPLTAEELADLTGLRSDYLFRILRLMAGVGVLTRDPGDRFGLTDVGQLLRTNVHGSLQPIAEYMTDPWCWQPWKEFANGLTNGDPIFERTFGKPVFEYLAEHPAEAEVFNAGMTGFSEMVSHAILQNYQFRSFTHIIDVGGGHGSLLAHILKQNPSCRGTVFDAPQVIEGAKTAIRDQRLDGRCDAVGGNFFESVPAGGDLYVLKHIVHDWNDEKALTILKNTRRAIANGGKVILVEMVVPESNEPSFAHLLDLEMMVVCDGKERTANEYRELLLQAGFRMTRILPLKAPPCIIEAEAAT